MKITVPQTDLVKALQAAVTLTKANAQLPVLSNALLSFQKDKATLKATDLSSGISLDLTINGEGEGKILVPVAQFLEYVQTLSSGEVGIVIGKNSLKVSQEGSSATFPQIDASEFPDFSPEKVKRVIRVKSDIFLDALKKAMVAVAIDDSRPTLTGILFRMQPEEKRLQVVGTDGYRLSVCSVSFEGDWEKDMVIPAKQLASLVRGEGGDVVEMGFDGSNNQAWLQSGDRTMVVRLLQGEFPNFSKIIPQTSTTEVAIDREVLLQGVQQTSVFARQNANIVKMDVAKEITLSTQDGISGSSRVVLDAKIEGEPLLVAFNYRYLREYLAAMGKGDVLFSFNGSEAPVKLIPSNEPAFLHIIMPVKL
mgnify:CR=1 FL=1